MIDKNNSYGSLDPVQTISEIIINYFDDLGEAMIAFQSNGDQSNGEMKRFTNPIYTKRLLNLGLASNILDGFFNCGRSSKINQELFGNSSGIYYKYIERLYLLQLELLGWKIEEDPNK